MNESEDLGFRVTGERAKPHWPRIGVLGTKEKANMDSKYR
jgi:hypothetical protein